MEETGIVKLPHRTWVHFSFSAVLQKEFGIKGRRFLVFADIGNNGGDGCVLDRKIHSNGGLSQGILIEKS
jgi:NAD(P)H-hydrate repair Nnr-like enzyme with NAD(P)H-hydrate epimerase domain